MQDRTRFNTFTRAYGYPMEQNEKTKTRRCERVNKKPIVKSTVKIVAPKLSVGLPETANAEVFLAVEFPACAAAQKV